MKRVLLLIAAVFVAVVLVSCSNQNDVSENSASDEITEDNVDVIEESSEDNYENSNEDFGLDEEANEIRNKLSGKSNEYQYEFLSFWRSMQKYCTAIKNEMRTMKNTASYEFDPSDANKIPQELKNVIDPERIKMYDTMSLFGDFNMIIDGYNVTFSFEGIVAYPSKYDYEDIQLIIDSLH